MKYFKLIIVCINSIYLWKYLADNVDPVPSAGACLHGVGVQGNMLHKVTKEVSALHGDNLIGRPHHALENKSFSGLDTDL